MWGSCPCELVLPPHFIKTVVEGKAFVVPTCLKSVVGVSKMCYCKMSSLQHILFSVCWISCSHDAFTKLVRLGYPLFDEILLDLEYSVHVLDIYIYMLCIFSMQIVCSFDCSVVTF